MAKTVHHGGKVGAAGKTLASNSSSKSAKSKAGTTLATGISECSCGDQTCDKEQ